MKELTYEETLELEANVKIKNRSNEIYSDFMKYFTVDVSKFKDGKFLLWSDAYNATYLVPEKDGFVYQCRFLHESYDVKISPSAIFEYIKIKYRGLSHLESDIDIMKKRM